MSKCSEKAVFGNKKKGVAEGDDTSFYGTNSAVYEYDWCTIWRYILFPLWPQGWQ